MPVSFGEALFRVARTEEIELGYKCFRHPHLMLNPQNVGKDAYLPLRSEMTAAR